MSAQSFSEGKANVVFDEWAAPHSKHTRLFKELQLVLSNDGWKITRERAAHVCKG